MKNEDLKTGIIKNRKTKTGTQAFTFFLLIRKPAFYMPPENLVNEGATEGAAFVGAVYRINVKFTNLLNYLDGFDTSQLNMFWGFF